MSKSNKDQKNGKKGNRRNLHIRRQLENQRQDENGATCIGAMLAHII